VRQKITAAVIALVLGSFAAIGAFASQDKVDLGAAGRFFSGAVTADVTPGVDTPTATATATVDLSATPTDTSTPEATATDTPAATDTPSATDTAGPTETAVAGCEEADDDQQAASTPAAGNSNGDCDDAHENQSNHEGLECGQGHREDDDDSQGAGGTPTAPADTQTPDLSGTPTIVAQMPVHCHGAHGAEHDDGHHSGDNHSGDHHDD